MEEEKEMERKRGFLFLLGLGILGLLLASNAAAEGRGVSKDTIKMGMILVKTGPVAALGLPEGWGVEDTFNEVNQKGGINGRKIDFIWEDDQFKTPNAISSFKKLIFRDNVLSIVTPGGTPQTIALFDEIDKNKVVTIPNGLADEMYEPFKPYIFLLGATYETQIDLMFDYIINDLKAQNPRIAVVYAETEFGKKGLHAAQKRAQKYGIKLVSELVLNIGLVDASSQVLALKKDNVDYVITCNLVPPIIIFSNRRKIRLLARHVRDQLVKRRHGGEGLQNSRKKLYRGQLRGGLAGQIPGMERVRKLAEANQRDPGKMLTSLYTMGGVSEP